MELNRAEFRAWLAARLDQTVGTGREECGCPLANFLSPEDPSADRVKVVDQEFLCDTGWVPLPSWAQDFVELVDTQFDEEREVSGRAALAILDGIQ